MKPNGPAAEKTKRITLEVMNGPEDGKVLPCDKMPVSIGRATDNIVHLPYDHLISRHHAKIIKSKDKLLLRDLNSTNGTFVKGERVRESAPIKLNQLFRVGATLLTIKLRSI